MAPRRLMGEEASERIEKLVTDYMAKREVPGGQFAMGSGGKVVYSKGFGFGEREKQVAVAPESLFRIASVSKPLTAVAILALVEDGKLSLDTKMNEVLKIDPYIAEGAKVDERVGSIAIRHLLNHTAGWDRDQAGDPMFQSRMIAGELKVECPPRQRDIIRWMLGRPLQFDPGARYAYSNLGYCILGRIIENLSGGSYEKFVRERVLIPSHAEKAKLGATLTTAEDEVHYYMSDKVKEKPTGSSIFPGLPPTVPSPYGCWSLEAMDSHGGWISSAENMVRFIMNLGDMGAASPLKKKSTWETMIAPPDGAPGHDEKGGVKNPYYACGFQVHEGKAGPMITHAGSLPGTTTYLWRRSDGIAWGLFFNQRCAEKGDRAIEGQINRILDAG